MSAHTSNNEDEESCLAAIAVAGCGPGARREFTALMQSGMRGSELRRHLTPSRWQAARAVFNECCERSIDVVPISSRRYPQLLQHIPNPPPLLYVRSKWPNWRLPERALAVVGTRAASVEVCCRASEIALDIASAGFTVVSGLALGVDGAAHRGALGASPVAGTAEGHSRTVAVLAHGLDRTYPPSHAPLAEEIVCGGGAVVSEYPPGQEAMKHHFLERNRIIAGMSLGVVVVQAGARSGSLVTARFAADYGRDVFIFENGACDTDHAGGRQMLEDGALSCSCAADILREYQGIDEPAKGREPSPEISVDQYLTQQGITFAELVQREFSGLIERLPGNRIRVRR